MSSGRAKSWCVACLLPSVTPHLPPKSQTEKGQPPFYPPTIACPGNKAAGPQGSAVPPQSPRGRPKEERTSPTLAARRGAVSQNRGSRSPAFQWGLGAKLPSRLASVPPQPPAAPTGEQFVPRLIPYPHGTKAESLETRAKTCY